MNPQAKESLGSPGAERNKKDPPTEPSEGLWPYSLLDFRLLSSRTMEEYISLVLSHQISGDLLLWLQESGRLSTWV